MKARLISQDRIINEYETNDKGDFTKYTGNLTIDRKYKIQFLHVIEKWFSTKEIWRTYYTCNEEENAIEIFDWLIENNIYTTNENTIKEGEVTQ